MATQSTWLISGFEAFGGESVNPTAELLFDSAWLSGLGSGVSVQTVILPVTFAGAYARLEREIRAIDPDVVICLGLAGGRDAINVERVALNLIDARIADNAGERPVDRPIVAGGPAALFCTLPVRRMVEASLAVGVRATLSETAGLYVCNHVLYRLLESQRFSRRRCGFVHVPFLPEQAERQKMPTGQLAPSMTLEDMKRGLSAMFNSLLRPVA